MPKAPGRPSSPRIRRDKVLETALTIIDDEGLDALSMRRLGRALGVHGASLYHHFANKDAILDGVVEHLAGTIDLEVPEEATWVESLRALARSYRKTMLAHPNAVDLLANRAVTTPKALSMFDHFVGLLVDDGWPLRLALAVVDTVEYYVLGSSFAPGDDPTAWLEPDAADEGKQQYPRLRAALESEPADEHEAFELGLDALLRGLQARLAALK